MPAASFDNPDRVGLYLADSEDTAWLYADLAQGRRGGDQVLLEIDPAALDKNRLEPDDYDLQTQLDDINDPDYDGVGANMGEPIDERLRGHLTWRDVPAELSLEVTNQIVYTAVIPPSSIRVVEIIPRRRPSKATGPAM